MLISHSTPYVAFEKLLISHSALYVALTKCFLIVLGIGEENHNRLSGK